MADLRIRIELKRPSKGIEMSKLAALAEETQKFLRLVAEDAGLNPNEGTWVARDFYNQGVGFNVEYQFAEVDQAQAAGYLHLIDDIAKVEREHDWKVQRARPITVLQSAKVATLADDGEVIRIGLLNGGDGLDIQEKDWRPLLKSKATAIIEHYETWVEYRGMLQGLIHSLFKEVTPPYFTLRDFASRELIRCEFKATEWDAVHRALEHKNAVVLVAGWIRAKRIDKSIASVRVERIESTRQLTETQLRGLFGSVPGWAGDLTSDEFIARVREEDGE
jgi:hypothetical protein